MVFLLLRFLVRRSWEGLSEVRLHRGRGEGLLRAEIEYGLYHDWGGATKGLEGWGQGLLRAEI